MLALCLPVIRACAYFSGRSYRLVGEIATADRSVRIVLSCEVSSIASYVLSSKTSSLCCTVFLSWLLAKELGVFDSISFGKLVNVDVTLVVAI